MKIILLSLLILSGCTFIDCEELTNEQIVKATHYCEENNMKAVFSHNICDGAVEKVTCFPKDNHD